MRLFRATVVASLAANIRRQRTGIYAPLETHMRDNMFGRTGLLVAAQNDERPDARLSAFLTHNAVRT